MEEELFTDITISDFRIGRGPGERDTIKLFYTLLIFAQCVRDFGSCELTVRQGDLYRRICFTREQVNFLGSDNWNLAKHWTMRILNEFEKMREEASAKVEK